MAKLGKLLNEYKSKFASDSLALVNSLETAAKGKSIPQAVLDVVAARMVPYVRRELAATYKASGLKQVTGELYDAVVNQSIIKVFPDNIVVYMASGKPASFYRRAAALRYGAVQKTGGATIKRKIKLAMVASGKGGVTKSYQFFDFSEASKARLKTVYDNLLAATMKGAM
jgi:hypothetical protein